jgi:hypothetical protein
MPADPREGLLEAFAAGWNAERERAAAGERLSLRDAFMRWAETRPDPVALRERIEAIITTAKEGRGGEYSASVATNRIMALLAEAS